jgi:alginate production protein
MGPDPSKNLLNERDDNEPDHFYARAYNNLKGDMVGSGYGLHQRGRDADDPQLTRLGVSLAGCTKSDIDYWTELAHVSGTEDDRNVRGFGLDVGLTKTFKKHPRNPRLTVGFAFGSEDDGSGTDTAFRQTGLQGNEVRFGGKTRVNSYGQVLDPELSNLVVFTLGTGFDIPTNSTLDVMYNTSFQHIASDCVRDSSIPQNPTGDSRQLGHEVNVVAAFRELERFDIDVYGGFFFAR